jgi:hypothetical protein
MYEPKRMEKFMLIKALNTDAALGSDDDILRVLKTMKKAKLHMLYRLMNVNYIHRNGLNSDLTDNLSSLITHVPKSKFDALEKDRNEQYNNFKRSHNYYLLKYVFNGLKQARLAKYSKENTVHVKLYCYNLRLKAKYLSILKSNVYDRKKQKLNFDIRGLSQNVFDLRDELKLETREKNKTNRELKKQTKELKHTSEANTKAMIRIKELERQNIILNPDKVLESINKISQSAVNSELLMAKLHTLSDNRAKMLNLNFKNLLDVFQTEEDAKPERLEVLFGESIEKILVRYILYCRNEIITKAELKIVEVRTEYRRTEKGPKKEQLSIQLLNYQKFIGIASKVNIKHFNDLDNHIYLIF